jgi:hypothetical protein
MKFLLSLTIALLSAKPAPHCEVYATVAASDAWMSHVKQLSQLQQLVALRQRLACDAQVRGRIAAAAVCVSCLTAEGRRAYQEAQQKRHLAEAADARPPGITLFYLIDGRPVDPADKAQWQPLVTRKLVQTITFIESEEAIVLGGPRAQDGMVAIATKKQ